MALLAISFRWLQRVKCETICWQLGEITEIEAKERHVVFRVPDGKGKTRRFVWLLPTQEETDAVAARLRGEIHERWAATLASTRSRSQFRLRPPLTDVLTVPRRISVEDEQVTITGRTGLRHPHAGWWALGISAAGFVILRVILEARFAALGLGAPEFPALAVVSAAMLAIGLIFLPTALLINLWYARGIRLPRKAISVTVQEDRRLVFEIHGKWRIELLAASEADARALCAAFTPPSASPDASPHPTLTPPR